MQRRGDRDPALVVAAPHERRRRRPRRGARCAAPRVIPPHFISLRLKMPYGRGLASSAAGVGEVVHALVGARAGARLGRRSAASAASPPRGSGCSTELEREIAGPVEKATQRRRRRSRRSRRCGARSPARPRSRRRRRRSISSSTSRPIFTLSARKPCARYSRAATSAVCRRLDADRHRGRQLAVTPTEEVDDRDAELLAERGPRAPCRRRRAPPAPSAKSRSSSRARLADGARHPRPRRISAAASSAARQLAGDSPVTSTAGEAQPEPTSPPAWMRTKNELDVGDTSRARSCTAWSAAAARASTSTGSIFIADDPRAKRSTASRSGSPPSRSGIDDRHARAPSPSRAGLGAQRRARRALRRSARARAPAAP